MPTAPAPPACQTAGESNSNELRQKSEQAISASATCDAVPTARLGVLLDSRSFSVHSYAYQVPGARVLDRCHPEKFAAMSE